MEDLLIIAMFLRVYVEAQVQDIFHLKFLLEFFFSFNEEVYRLFLVKIVSTHV